MTRKDPNCRLCQLEGTRRSINVTVNPALLCPRHQPLPPPPAAADHPERVYQRERYAGILEIRPDRVTEAGELKDPEHVADVMGRWLARCVRDEPIVMGRATATAHAEMFTGRWVVRGEAPCYLDVEPDDATVLRDLVNSEAAQMVLIAASVTDG